MLFKRCTQRAKSNRLLNRFQASGSSCRRSGSIGGGAAGLLLINLDDIVLLHLQGLRGLVVVDPAAVKQEPEGGDGDADPLAVGLLELAHLCCLFHPEVDFVAVLSWKKGLLNVLQFIWAKIENSGRSDKSRWSYRQLSVWYTLCLPLYLCKVRGIRKLYLHLLYLHNAMRWDEYSEITDIIWRTLLQLHF